MKNIILAALFAFFAFALAPAFGQQQAPTPPGLSSLGGYAKLSVTATTGNVVVPVVPTNAFPAITIYNSGTKDAFFALGGSTVAATTSSTKIGAGVSITIWLGPNTYVAAICGGSDTTTLDLYQASSTIYLSRP